MGCGIHLICVIMVQCVRNWICDSVPKMMTLQKFGEKLQILTVKNFIYLKNETHDYNKIQHSVLSLIRKNESVDLFS